MNIKEYIAKINEQYQIDGAREHAYRPALQELFSSLLPNLTVTNEPARIACGAPDFIFIDKKAKLPIAFAETKDIDDGDLDGRRQNKEQFNRYKNSLDTIIFTDYLDFHLYEHERLIKNVRIAEIKKDKIVLIEDNLREFNAIISHIGTAKTQKITSSTKLAEQMAAKAKLLAETIKKAFSDDNKKYDNSQLRGQYEAFKKVLIHDLTSDAFADIYAQTIAYGMFAARLHDTTPEDFSREEAAKLIPKSNPFLRQIFQNIAGYDLDERIVWIVDDLATTFGATDMQKVMGTYAQNEVHNDPMIHFYENFLAAYDPALRDSKGVFYTPEPVVKFIVKSVDEILKKEFHLNNGLADYDVIEKDVINDQYSGKKGESKTLKREFHKVQVLDPAAGTGTFLAEIIRQIYHKFENMKGAWQGYVEDNLLPRINGFEILMAPYAIAHLKLDMLLQNTGYIHKKNKRFQIYLTNSLEECHPDTGTLFSTWLSQEATEANYVKRDYPVMVMLGNPPYSGESCNKGKWIMDMMKDYKKEPGGTEKLNERNPKWINDDYVKFIRLGQHYIEKNGVGILAFISNNGFLDNPTFRGMRWNLMKSFDKIYILNLHGNSLKREVAPDGSKDENVFDITVGTSINIFIKTGKKDKKSLAQFHYAEIYGKREKKYDYLRTHSYDTVNYQCITPIKNYYFFVPKDFKLTKKYEKGFKICDLIPINSMGITTGNDKNLVSCFPFPSDYNSPYCYRPFDKRWVDYDTRKIERPRKEVMCHLQNENISIALIKVNSSSDGLFKIFITDSYTDKSILSSKDNANVFPLYLYVDGRKEANLNFDKWNSINKILNKKTTPKEIILYVYAFLYSPWYRESYKEFLKIDFPRIPYPSDEKFFDNLSKVGERLANIHLMKDSGNWEVSVTYPEVGENIVEKIKYVPDSGKVYINKKQYFGNVSQSAWNCFIGGYQPAQKWLENRKGRCLNFTDIRHYMEIIYALEQTEKIMNEIDSIIRQTAEFC